MNTRLTDDQHQKAVHLLAERLTLQASLGDVYAHYYQSQARSPTCWTPPPCCTPLRMPALPWRT